MSKTTLQIISGITTAVATATVTVANLVCPDKAAVISGVTVAVAGLIDEVCMVFIKNNGLEA